MASGLMSSHLGHCWYRRFGSFVLKGSQKLESFPVGREGVIGDVANAGVFLFSDAAPSIVARGTCFHL